MGTKMKLPIIYRGKDFQFDIGPLYLDSDIQKENPIDLTQDLLQLTVSTFTDIRFKSVSVINAPTIGQWQLIKVTDYVYTCIIPSDDTILMKTGTAIVEIETEQIGSIFPDGINNQGGEDYKFEVRDL